MTQYPTIPTNPFSNRGMIPNIDGFAGREKELVKILERLQSGNSVSLVGERRMGKSSIANHIFLTGNERLQDAQKQKFSFLYLSFQSSKLRTPLDFVKSILQVLQYSIDENKVKENPMAILEDILDERIAQSKPKIILLLDEFESVFSETDKGKAFGDDFLENLRALGNAKKLTMMLISLTPLRELLLFHKMTSPIYNIFTVITLDVFSESEVQNFIEKYWTAFSITEQEKIFLHNYTHPMKLQIASFHLLKMRKIAYTSKDFKMIKKEIASESKSYFMNTGGKWAFGIKRGFHFIVRILKKIIPAIKSAEE